jgi:hypothetical protein
MGDRFNSFSGMVEWLFIPSAILGLIFCLHRNIGIPFKQRSRDLRYRAVLIVIIWVRYVSRSLRFYLGLLSAGKQTDILFTTQGFSCDEISL